MSNNLHVTLDTHMDPPRLDIDQNGGANQVAHGPSAQTITWELTGNAAAGSFDSQDDSAPGFAWVDSPPPTGIFGDPVLSQNGNQITMSDLNNSSRTVGEWTYQLSATIGGVVYQSDAISDGEPYPTSIRRSNAALVADVTTNPTIKNN